MKKAIEVYKESKAKNEKDLYNNLKTNLKNIIKEDPEMLKVLQLECECSRFVDFNISAASFLIAFASLGFSVLPKQNKGLILQTDEIIIQLVEDLTLGNIQSFIVFVGAIGFVVFLLIKMHLKEVKHKKVLFVLNEIEKEMGQEATNSNEQQDMASE